MAQRYTDDRSLSENVGRRGGIKVATPDPTPEEIAAEAAKIRESWTAHGRRNRHYMGEYRVRSLEPLTVPGLELPTTT